MRCNAHLTFNGSCKEALRAYAQCLGAEITSMLTYGESPSAETFPDLKDNIIHATLTFADSKLTGADLRTAHYEKPAGFALQLDLARNEDALRVFNSLSRGGVVAMPLQKTFWAETYAVFTDRFGIPWEINGA